MFVVMTKMRQHHHHRHSRHRRRRVRYLRCGHPPVIAISIFKLSSSSSSPLSSHSPYFTSIVLITIRTRRAINTGKAAVTMCRPVCIYAAATKPTRRMMNGEAINGHLGKGWKGIVTIFVGSFGAPTGRNPRNWLILRHFKRTFFRYFSWFLLMLPEIFVTPRRFGTLPCSEVESLMPPGPLSPQSLVRPHWET